MIINGTQLGLQQQIRKTNDSLQKSTGKLSSGKRITSAAVDAAGLAISEKLRALQMGSQQALRNVQDAHSLVQTADGAMQELTEVVQRIRELTIQAMNGTNMDTKRSGSNADTLLIQNEIDALKRNLGDIVGNTEFNTKKLLTNKEPGEYIIADRQVTASFPAKSAGSSNAVITGVNDSKTDSVGYTREVVVASSTIPVSQTPITYEPIGVNMSTVVDHLPKWSADGSSILFTSSRDNGTYRVGIDGVTDPIEDVGTASAPFKTTVRNYRLIANGSSLELQKNDGYSWKSEKSFSYLSADGNTGFSFSPSMDAAGNTSFVFSDGLGNLSKVDLNVYTGEIGPEISLIPTTDRLHLPPQNNTLLLSRTPDLYRMNAPEASLVIKKVTDSGERALEYWNGMGSEPLDGYYTVTNNRVTFYGNAIIGNETLDDAQDYYTFQYVGGSGSDFHTELIPSGAQLYNLHGEEGPMSLKVTVGNREVQRNEFLTERPIDVENTTGVYVDEVLGKIEFYGDLRPSARQNVDIRYMSDSDSDRTVQTYSLPSTIDTYNLENDDQSAPRSLRVYIGGREVAYDPTKTNGYTYDPATKRISLYGDSRPDIPNGDQLSIRYVADKSMTQTSPDVYGIPLGTPKPEVFNLGMEGVPNSIRVYRGNEEITFSGTNGFLYNEQTNTIELYGDSRPNVGDEYRVKMITVTGDPIKNDDRLEIPLSGRPEIYGVADPDILSTLKVTIDGREIPYDLNKRNGFFYNSNTNRVEIYGDQLPDANEVAVSPPAISVQFVKEGSAVTLGNHRYDIQLATGASTYGIDGNGTVKGMKVYRGNEEVPYEDESGFTYDEATGILSLHGKYRPTTDDAAGLYRVVSVPEQVLTATVPNGSTVHKVFMNNAEVQKVDSEHSDGYVYENGKVQLIGEGRPDAAKGNSSYQLTVIYTDPLLISLAVDPLSTATTGYCEHETGSALPDAELVPGSLTVRLNNVELNKEQYRMEGNRVHLIGDDLPVNAGNNTLTANYQIRQGIDYKDNSFTFQVGGNSGNQKVLKIASFDNMLQNISAVCVRTADHAEKGLDIIDQSMKFILSELGNIGAAENSFDHISANLEVTEEALTSALSRIEDVDMAKEIMNSTKLQILSQAQQALAGQGRQMQESVLKLLQ